MEKIKTLFKRNFPKKGIAIAIDEVEVGCEWVTTGEGIATQKIDGMCSKIENGLFYKRYDAKNGKTPPIGFLPAQEPDKVTGHWPGWLLVDDKDPANKIFLEAFNKLENKEDGTYEVIGPRISTRGGLNAENKKEHTMVKHGEVILDCPRDFDGLKEWLTTKDMEGIVFHHPDGRMCKIKKTDFGLKR